MFVDTGAFLARYIERDQHHQSAVEVWNELRRERIPLFTSNLVLAETATLLARRSSGKIAAQKVGTIYRSPTFSILYSNREQETEALSVLEKFSDQQISFTDAVSFVLMEQRGIGKAFCFDWHFRLAGFEVCPPLGG